MDMNEQINEALGLMANNIAQRQHPSKSDFLTSYLRGQQPPQTFAEGAGMPMQPPTVSMAQRQNRPPPASMQPPLPPPPMQRPNPMPTGQGPVPGQQQMPPGPGGPPQQGALPQTGPAYMQPNPVNAGPNPGGPPVDALGQQYDDLMKRRAAASAEEEKAYAPPDRSKAEATYKERVEGGNQALLRALAAQQAGPGFAPMQQHFMQQSEAARAPMKTTGGTFTPEGFIEDTDRTAELNIKRIQARISQYDNLLNSNITAQEKARIAKEKLASEQQLKELVVGAQLAAAQAASADRRYMADLMHTDRQAALDAKTGAAGQGKILPANTVTALTEGQNKARDIARLTSEFKPEFAGAKGSAMNAAGQYVPFVTTDAAEWWKNYRKEDELVTRHGLFGAALTATELASWRAADISPGMDPGAIERNLKRRSEIIAAKHQALVSNFQRSGYNTEAFPVDNLPTGQTGSTGATWAAPPPTGQAGPLVKARAAAAARGGASGAPGVVDFNALPKGQ